MLRAGTRGAAGRRSRTLRDGLVVAQIALAYVLTVNAGLLLRSFVALTEAPLGFRTDSVLVMYAHAPARGSIFEKSGIRRLPPRRTHVRRCADAHPSALDTLANGGHIRIVEGPFAIHRSKTGGQKQLILFTQGHREYVGESQHHRATRARSTRFDEADVAGGHVGLDRQVQLAQPAPLSPFPHQRADGWGLHTRGGGHQLSVAHGGDRSHYLAGNCTAYLGGGRLVA